MNYKYKGYEEVSRSWISRVPRDVRNKLIGLQNKSLKDKTILDIGSGFDSLGIDLYEKNVGLKVLLLDPAYKDSKDKIVQKMLDSLLSSVGETTNNILDDTEKISPDIDEIKDKSLLMLHDSLKIEKFYNLLFNKKRYEGIEMIGGVGEQIPFTEESIDFVNITCFANISSKVDQLFSEASRVLNKNGELIIIDYKGTKLYKKFKDFSECNILEEGDFFCVKLKKEEIGNIISLFE